MTIALNYSQDEIVSSPTVLISGSISQWNGHGIVRLTSDQNRLFPPQYAEVNNNNFKVLAHVSEIMQNYLNIEIIENGRLNPFGLPEFINGLPHVVERTQLRLNYYKLERNKPIHLCIILGKDSSGSFDIPTYRLRRGEVANLDTAIRKLKIAGRLMQAYTQEEMRNAGLSNRTFQFVEESVYNRGIYGYEDTFPLAHSEVKVHVLRSSKSVAELRDPNLAQQNPKAKDSGGLFNHAIDVIKNSPEFASKYKSSGTPIQCAVIYLDSHFDVESDLILAHAALGGGTGEIKLAIFGSHGLHSWPMTFPFVSPTFLDDTHLSKKEVANDANQSGTTWRCLNVTLGAFMHEIGHLLGSPHQVNGVMLRDYIWLNRSFMTRENDGVRGQIKNRLFIEASGYWPKECHWNRMDLVRYFFHGSFGIPTDTNFGKVYTTYIQRFEGFDYANVNPSMYHVSKDTAVVSSKSGIFMIEFVVNGLARHHVEFFPRSYGGPSLQRELVLNYESLWSDFSSVSKEADESFDLRLLSLGGDLYIENFKNKMKQDSSYVRCDLGPELGVVIGYKSTTLGRSGDKKENLSVFDLSTIGRIRIYHGSALDGIRFYRRDISATETISVPNGPTLPKRNYFSRAINKVKQTNVPEYSHNYLVGRDKADFSEFILYPNETIEKFHFRNGAWMDAVQFELSSGRKSPMYGNMNGGHLSTLEKPSKGLALVGFYWYAGSWLDGLGIIYTSEFKCY